MKTTPIFVEQVLAGLLILAIGALPFADPGAMVGEMNAWVAG